MATQRSSVDRRRFIGAALTASAAVACGSLGSGIAAASSVGGGPFLRTSKNRLRNIVGQGDYQYEMNHNWAKLPERFTWQTTHNVAVDPDGLVYVIHEGHENKPDHPSIFVFDPDGRFVRSFGSQFQGGGHGLEVRVENGTPFLYVAAYQQVKCFAKLDLQGETVWEKYAPMESGKYAENEDTQRQRVWGRDRFLPTNFAFLPDGGFLLADGYGAFVIHRYDKDANWISCFGGPGPGEGTFDTPHGLWLDQRGEQTEIVVTDRAKHRLQFFDMEGKYLRTMDGFGMPANVDAYQELLMVPELHARISLLGPGNQVVAHLGADVERVTSGDSIRTKPDQWLDGKFVHPHDACFDHQGNILVAEWVGTGRVSKLTRV